MDESFASLRGRKICNKDTNKCLGRLSDILVSKGTNEIIGIISKNEALIYPRRLFYLKEVTGYDEISIYVEGYGEKFAKVVPILTDFKSMENDIYKRKAIFTNGKEAGKIQNVNLSLETGIITGFEIGFSLAQDLLNGRKLCPAQNTISYRSDNIVLENNLIEEKRTKKYFFDEVGK